VNEGATVNTGVKLIEVEQTEETKENTLSQLISSAFAKSNPKKITEVSNENAKNLTGFPMSDGSFKSGLFVNTTRNDSEQSYTYMWNKKCYFKKYTPSNQYLNSLVAPYRIKEEVDYSHFGMIGHLKDCFWGLFGVTWIKPLPVFQEHKALKSHHGYLNGTYTS